MKSDVEIKDDVYMHIKGSALELAVTGKLSKTKRPNGSIDEDIVISVLANQNAQLQEAFVNVNVYVRDVERDGQKEEDTIRTRELCEISEEVLERFFKDDFRCVLDSQRVVEIEGKGEHMINNKLLYKQVNDTYYGNRMG